jgi:hypothetical protein
LLACSLPLLDAATNVAFVADSAEAQAAVKTCAVLVNCLRLQVKGSSEQATALRNGGATDSVGKLHRVLQLCDELGVITQPTQLGGLLLVPLLSWHHAVSVCFCCYF